MKAVDINVLRNKLSEYVRLAASGETVQVTDGDHVVAELVPPTPHHSEFSHDRAFAELVRKGIVIPPTGKHLPLVWPAPVQTLAQTLKELDEDREDR